MHSSSFFNGKSALEEEGRAPTLAALAGTVYNTFPEIKVMTTKTQNISKQRLLAHLWYASIRSIKVSGAWSGRTSQGYRNHQSLYSGMSRNVIDPKLRGSLAAKADTCTAKTGGRSVALQLKDLTCPTMQCGTFFLCSTSGCSLDPQ